MKILGINLLANEDDLHLLRDYKSDEICWEYKNDNILIDVDAQRGRIVNYSDLNGDVSTIEFSEDLLNKLNIIDGYEIMSDEVVDGNRIVEYAKKYGDIFNKYQSTTVIIKDNRILNISSVYYEYEDKEVLVSKEEALKILKDNGIEVSADDVELAIENVGVFSDNNQQGVNEEISEENIDEFEFRRKQVDVRMVWKTLDGKYFIDVSSSNVIKRDIQSKEEKNMSS